MTQADTLSDLLEAERAALLAGDFTTLEGLLPLKEALHVTLAEQPNSTTGTAAERLRTQAAANEALLKAALLGLRAAQATVTNAAARECFETYDKRGQRRSISSNADTAQHRV